MGGGGADRGGDGWTASLTHWGLSELWEMVKDREAWRAAVHGITVRHNSATEQQERSSKQSFYELQTPKQQVHTEYTL